MMDTSRPFGSCGFVYTIYINIILRVLDYIKL